MYGGFVVPSSTWNKMNRLDEIFSKVVELKEIANSIWDASERQDYEKIQSMSNLINNYIDYVTGDWDKAFKEAWHETVGKE
jgi:hypothetical protein